ncbi:ATP11-domain-containing protein [Karstenula rhodostoma CBS 690.94]|uniref:ATP11-domain-containing protein n=1 Tax=Karstenula rhodostoma CBS 690.94 TaxID=1392251 RepID=A0A9P4PE31_9PLEO|nr:ATP11-domain-containing protein [Karstenula rhodostoma CBS 690.94]
MAALDPLHLHLHPHTHTPAMAALRMPTLRYLARQASASPRACQRRWARVQDVRFHATHGAQERILTKYRDKLESKARQEGLPGISELKEAYKDRIEELRKQASVPGATAPLAANPAPAPQSPSSPSATTSAPASPWPAPPPPPTPQSASPATSKPPPGVKTLDSFLALDKITSLPAKEIQVLWRLRHASNPQSVHFSLPSAIFTTLLATAKRHPSFVLPLPREVPAEQLPDADLDAAQSQTAAELHYLQFTHPHADTTTLLFTSLAEYKLRGEFASPHTTITFHSELARSHDLVLGQGTVVEGRGVTVDEARFLVMCMQKFYVVNEEGKARGELLEMFTRGDGGFRVERLLEEAEKIV